MKRSQFDEEKKIKKIKNKKIKKNKILIVIMGWSLEWAIFKTIKKKSAISTFVWREYGLQRGGRMAGLHYVAIKSLSNLGL